MCVNVSEVVYASHHVAHQVGKVVGGAVGNLDSLAGVEDNVCWHTQQGRSKCAVLVESIVAPGPVLSEGGEEGGSRYAPHTSVPPNAPHTTHSQKTYQPLLHTTLALLLTPSHAVHLSQ